MPQPIFALSILNPQEMTEYKKQCKGVVPGMGSIIQQGVGGVPPQHMDDEDDEEDIDDDEN